MNKKGKNRNKMVQWEDVRNKLFEMYGNVQPFVTDLFYISLNYGYCYNQGKHQNTSNEHWQMFELAILNNEPAPGG